MPLSDPPYDALLFDLDGTLVDSLPDLRTAANLLRSDLELPPLDLEAVKSCVGDGARMLVQRALPTGEFTEHRLQKFLAYYAEHLAEGTTPYHGVRPMLDQLRHLPLAVVTNKPHDLTCLLLDQLGLSGCFQIVIGGDSCPQKKPSPEPLNAALAALECRPEQALMIGDHHTDLRAGRAAGTRTCFCSWGYGEHGGQPYDLRAGSVMELRQLLGAE
ncbi:MAG: phosphoglycolate phosphatase [Desulfuromonas sp.]|nr:MAG: phosphoglycolate phosphatase [Desulfuromonas sp.]